VLERSTTLRFAAVATALVLAAPVWATEIQMKKKEDPKAQKQSTAQQEQKQSESRSAKKNCPENSFNTLEDLFAAGGSIDPVTGLPVLPATQAVLATQATPAAAPALAQSAAPAVEWRAVDSAAAAAKPETAKPKAEEPKKD